METKLGEKLYELRKKHGYSQEALADILNVSRQAIYKWETDQTMLQFTVVTGNSGEPHVVLTLVRK